MLDKISGTVKPRVNTTPNIARNGHKNIDVYYWIGHINVF